MVHGLGGSSLNWTALTAALADRLDARAPDLPGFGHSPPPHDGDYTLEGHARAVTTMIEADARGPVHLFGNSMGGAIATTVAASRPDLVRSLTLISPALPDFVPNAWRARVILLAAPGLGPIIAKKVAAISPKARIDALLDLCFAEPERVPQQWREAAQRDVAERQRHPYAADAMVQSTRGLASAYLDRGEDRLWRRAAAVEAPTLLLFGGQDKLVRSDLSGRAGRAFPRSRVVVLPGTGHVAQMEHPRVVARFVAEHLDQSVAAPSTT